MDSRRSGLSPEQIRARIVKLAALTAEREERRPLTFRCPTCQDTYYVSRDGKEGFWYARPCPDCEDGQAVLRGWAKRGKVPDEPVLDNGFRQIGEVGDGEDLPF